MQTGTADGGEMTGSKSNFEMLRSFNDNGEVTGNVVTTYSWTTWAMATSA